MPFDEDMVHILHKEMTDHNINIITNDGLAIIHQDAIETQKVRKFLLKRLSLPSV